MMKKITLLILISLTILSCSGKKSQQFIRLDNSKTEYAIQEGFNLPVLSKSNMVYLETKRIKKYSESFKKHSLKSWIDDTITKQCYKERRKKRCKSFQFFNGYLATIFEEDSIKAKWKDKNNKEIYFKWKTEIGYYENKKIRYSKIYLWQEKLQYDFEIGTKYFFDQNGKLIDSIDFGKHYKTSFEKIYKKLYEISKPFNYENIDKISRYFDAVNSLWIISYNNQESDIILEDKTLEIHFLKYKNTKEFQQSIMSIYKYFDFEYKTNKDHLDGN